jgi:hypothetical protein
MNKRRLRSSFAVGLLAVGFATSAAHGQFLDESLRDGVLPSGWTATEIDFRTAAGGYALFQETTSVLTSPVFDASQASEIEVAYSVAKFGSGEDGPLEVQYSLDGASWIPAGDSPTPDDSTYIDDTITIPTTAETMQIRFLSASSPSRKRLRDVIVGERARLTLDLDVSSISEGGLDFITGTVTASAPVSGNTLITVALSDGSEATTADAEIFDGETEGTFIISPVDDAWPDGDREVTVAVSGPLFDPAEATFTVTDDDSEFLLAIHEVYNHIGGLGADANGDGIANDTDEFVEIVNLSGGTLDLSGVELADSSFVRHVFPDGTVLEDGCSIVVIAGGDLPEGSTAAFGNAEVQIALSNPEFPGLFLDDDGDTLTLIDPFGSVSGLFGGELHAVDLPDQSAATVAESLTSAIDLDPGGGFVWHTTTSGGAPFSPGALADGTPICELTESLALTIEPGTRTEADGFVADAGTVSIPAALERDVTVRIDSSDTTEISTAGASPVVIFAGETTADIALDFIDDSLADGAQAIALTARASGFLNDTVEIQVEDDGDQPPFTDLVINEVDAQNPGTDSAEFIELFNRTSENQPLDGLVVVLYNGNGDQSYRTIALDGFTIPADGFFVIGSPEVANVDLADFTADSLQNGVDAVALYLGSVGEYPDGIPASTSAGTLVDAVVYDDVGGTDAGLQDALTPGQPVASEAGNNGNEIDAASRFPDGGTAFDTSVYTPLPASPGEPNGSGVVGGDFDSWATDNGVANEPFDGDSDGDGIPAGLEYALAGFDPAATDGGAAGTFADGVLSFTKRDEAVTNGDVSYVIEQSTDLGVNDPWAEVTPDVDDATTLSFTLPPGPGIDRVFVRLRVTQN